MSEEVKVIAQRLRAELLVWIEERTDLFIELLDSDLASPPQMPVIEDFRLLLCLGDAADPDASDWYPQVNSGTAFHRQLGLVEHASSYLKGPD